MIKLELKICFDAGSLSGDELRVLIDSAGLGFEPRYLRSRGLTDGLEPLSSGSLRRLSAWDGKSNLELRSSSLDQPGPRLWCLTVASKAVQTLSWAGISETFDPTTLVQQLGSNRGFNAAYYFDAEDVARQSSEALSQYKVHGWSTEGVSFIEDPTYPDRRIDISGNPGRATLLDGLWFISAPRIWFANRALEYFPLELLSGFSGACRLEQLVDHRVFLELLSGLHEASTGPGRAIQSAFRAWLGVDAIAHAQLAASAGEEAGYRIEEGTFQHGGNRRVTICWSANGRVVKREDAAWLEIFELDSRARIIWRSGRQRLRD